MHTVRPGAIRALLAATGSLLLAATGLLLVSSPTPAGSDCVDYATHPPYPLLGSAELEEMYPVAAALCAAGEHVYAVSPVAMTLPSCRLFVVDVGDPVNPALVGAAGVGGGNRVVVSDGSYAYVGNRDDSVGGFVRAFDVSPPAATAQVSAHDGWGGDLALVGNRLYEARYAVIEAIDVSNPAAPVTLGNLWEELGIQRIAAAGNYVYGAGYLPSMGGALFVVDFSNPASPVLTGTFLNPSGSHFGAIAVRGSIVVVRSSLGELLVIDVSDPSAPALLGGIATPATEEIAFDEAGVLYALGDRLYVYGLEDPTQPTLIGSTDLPWGVTRLAVGAHVYILHNVEPYRLAVDVIPLQCPVTTGVPPTPQIAATAFARPNPFRDQTEIRYDLAQPGVVRLNVYDVAGRLVRELQPAMRRDAGSHAVSWDGRDGTGRAVGTGAYYVRIAVTGPNGLDHRAQVRITSLE